MRIVAGIGAPLLAVLVWSLFVAPKATVPVPAGVRLLLEVAVFAAAAVALAAAGRHGLGWASRSPRSSTAR